MLAQALCRDSLPLCHNFTEIVVSIIQLATYMILDARTPFFSEKRAFLRKTWRVSYHFRCEEPQANSLCYKEATWVSIIQSS